MKDLEWYYWGNKIVWWRWFRVGFMVPVRHFYSGNTSWNFMIGPFELRKWKTGKKAW